MTHAAPANPVPSFPGKASRRRSMRMGDGFAQIALWQFLAFLVLILVIWVNEIVDLGALWFGCPPTPPDLFRGFALTAAVIVIAIITVGHTYEQEKRAIRGLLTVCSYCHRIRMHHEVWARMEEYLSEHSLALISHGVCPECLTRVRKELDDLEAK